MEETPEQRLTGVKPSVRHLLIFASKFWAQVPDKTHKASVAKARPGVLLPCFLYGMAGITLQDDRAVQTTRHFLVREDVLPTKQWQRVVRVLRNELEESLLHDCNEAAVY